MKLEDRKEQMQLVFREVTNMSERVDAQNLKDLNQCEDMISRYPNDPELRALLEEDAAFTRESRRKRMDMLEELEEQYKKEMERDEEFDNEPEDEQELVEEESEVKEEGEIHG